MIIIIIYLVIYWNKYFCTLFILCYKIYIFYSWILLALLGQAHDIRADQVRMLIYSVSINYNVVYCILIWRTQYRVNGCTHWDFDLEQKDRYDFVQIHS